MIKRIFYLSVLLSLGGCVSTSRYAAVQTDLQNTKWQAVQLQHAVDSVKNHYADVRSDLNSVSFDLKETQRYASFSDLELATELDKQRQEYHVLLSDIRKQKEAKEYTSWISSQRAEAFADEARCIFGKRSRRNFILIQQRTVLLDIEGLMKEATETSKGDLKHELHQLFNRLSNREDWKMNVRLDFSGTTVDFTKMTIQNELIKFMATDVQLPVERLMAVTHFMNEKKGTELDWHQLTASNLYLEIEFNV